jgi:hypothetical protein
MMCPKCFALLRAGSEFCVECGAVIKEGAEGSDTEVYTELSRANLLRMRGNMKEAIECSLGILRRFPNNVTAHTLLGDIYYEQDDLEQAAEWYEMALDLNPEAASERMKLEKVKAKLKAQEQSETVKQLGIEPAKQPNLTAIVASAVVLLLGVGGLAFAIGRSSGTGSARTGEPVTIAARGESSDTGNSEGAAPTGSQPVVSVAEDEPILAALRARLMGTSILSAHFNPATRNVLVTVVGEDSDLPAVAASVVSAVLDSRSEVKSVNVRVIQNGAISFVGRSTRTGYELARERVGADAPAAALVSQVFEGAWPPGSATVSVPPSTGSAQTPSESTPPESPPSTEASGTAEPGAATGP